MRLLLVEDDPKISHFLLKGLREDQHVGEKACTVLGQETEGSEGAVARYDASGQWLTTLCATDPVLTSRQTRVGTSAIATPLRNVA